VLLPSDKPVGVRGCVATAVIDRPLRAYIVTTEPPRVAGKERVTRRRAVLAENAEAAVDLVRERVAPECVVEAADEILSPEKASEIGLQLYDTTAL
jgi:hypothetical protein